MRFVEPPLPSPSPQRQLPPQLTPPEDRPQLPPHSFVTAADSAALEAAAAAETFQSPDAAAHLMDEAVMHGFMQLLPGARATASVPESVRPAQWQVGAQFLSLPCCQRVRMFSAAQRCIYPCALKVVDGAQRHCPHRTLRIPIAFTSNAVSHFARFALLRRPSPARSSEISGDVPSSGAGGGGRRVGGRPDCAAAAAGGVAGTGGPGRGGDHRGAAVAADLFSVCRASSAASLHARLPAHAHPRSPPSALLACTL